MATRARKLALKFATSLGWSSTWDDDPGNIWGSKSADIPKGSNHISYKNPELDAAIWAFLRAHSERNKFDLPNM